MNTQEVAKTFTDMCAKGEFDAAGKKFWSDDIVSREPMTGDMAVLKGRKAVEGKGQWWYANHEVHNAKVEGPYVHGDQFVVCFKMEVTPKGKKRMNLDEVGLYTVPERQDRRGVLLYRRPAILMSAATPAAEPPDSLQLIRRAKDMMSIS
jgi:hypothetical protein